MLYVDRILNALKVFKFFFGGKHLLNNRKILLENSLYLKMQTDNGNKGVYWQCNTDLW
jgi:hypothetical protein